MDAEHATTVQVHDGGWQHMLGVPPDLDEDRDWARLSIDQFLKGYADGDAAYDDLPAN